MITVCRRRGSWKQRTVEGLSTHDAFLPLQEFCRVVPLFREGDVAIIFRLLVAHSEAVNIIRDQSQKPSTRKAGDLPVESSELCHLALLVPCARPR